MKRRTLIIAIVLIVAILLIGLGYAAITGLTLNISGDATATSNDANFVVEFASEGEKAPQVSDPSIVKASIVPNDPKKATIEVSGLSAKGDTATATYTIQNKSKDLTANLSADLTNSNAEYFDVEYSLASTSLTSESDTTVTVTITLNKTLVTEEEVTSTIGLNIIAQPVQPE